MRQPQPPLILIDNLHVLEVFDDAPSVVRYPTWMIKELSNASITAFDSGGASWKASLSPVRLPRFPEFIYLCLLKNHQTEVEITYSEREDAPIETLRSAVEHVIGIDMTGLYHQYVSEDELAARLNDAQTFDEIYDLLTTSVFPDEPMRRVSETSEQGVDRTPDHAPS